MCADFVYEHSNASRASLKMPGGRRRPQKSVIQSHQLEQITDVLLRLLEVRQEGLASAAKPQDLHGNRTLMLHSLELSQMPENKFASLGCYAKHIIRARI